VVHAWACQGDADSSTLVSNTFTMEWPPRSGRQQDFPEVDRCAWFGVPEARRRINPAQVALLDRLEGALALVKPGRDDVLIRSDRRVRRSGAAAAGVMIRER
jgi:predicted NUDIX family NTP pyrophosphohydrolase